MLTTTGSLSNWTVLVTERSLASSAAGQDCGVTSLDAVGYDSGSATAGTSCAQPGVAGLFADVAGRWRLDGPALPPALAADTVAVTGINPRPDGLAVLLSTSGADGTGLVAASRNGGGTGWVVSPLLHLRPGTQLASWGQATGSGVFALVNQPSGSANLELLDGPGRRWRQLPGPPEGTATVAFGPASTVEALAVNDTVLTVWSLQPGTSRWVAGQVLPVSIEFGSSG